MPVQVEENVQNRIEDFAEMEARKCASRDWYEHLARRTDKELVAYTREITRGAIQRWNRVQAIPVVSEQDRLAWGRVYARNFFTLYREAYGQCESEAQLQAPATRVMFRCSNKKCGNAWAKEYYQSDGNVLFQVDGIKRIFLQNTFLQCPKCKSHSVKYSKVIGTVSDRTCDARCLNAKGPDCSCACGGLNHGHGLLLAS